MRSSAATAIDNPRQPASGSFPRRPVRTREPPLITAKKPATPATSTLSVSSQPEMSSHAGKVNRKKFNGRPNIGSSAAPAVPAAAFGVSQYSARTGHWAIMPAPLMSAMMKAAASAISRSTGSIGTRSG